MTGKLFLRFAARAAPACAIALAAASDPARLAADAEGAPPPVVSLVTPPAVARGGKATLRIRGKGLDAATYVRAGDPARPLAVTLRSRGKAAAPNGLDGARVGDTEVEVEVEVPADAPGERIPIAVVTPAGETASYPLLLLDPDELAAEAEPNDGFRGAQRVRGGQSLAGGIHEPRNVDVFRVEGKEGDVLACEVLAAGAGSPLDSILALFDERGALIAVADDRDGSRDAALCELLPAAGAYYVALMDAHDSGGPLHAYVLRVRLTPPSQGGGDREQVCRDRDSNPDGPKPRGF